MDEPRMLALLEEIRDLQRDHLEEYRKMAARSIAIAQGTSRLYRRVVVVSAPLFLLLVAYLLWVLRMRGG